MLILLLFVIFMLVVAMAIASFMDFLHAVIEYAKSKGVLTTKASTIIFRK